MVKVHLYGKLRRFAADRNPAAESIVHVSAAKGETIEDILRKIGIPQEDLGTNIFLNGEYSSLMRQVRSGDRLGVFPDNMQLLYRWYFHKAGDEAHDGPR
ncbi:MoaD/ThiS family protein [Candidatus Bipolaricaulota bacterium]|nr:MoaD/ThiS family protein [Candidatus Bipolaricaulota bacterium]